jgi:hypothetical protein
MHPLVSFAASSLLLGLSACSGTPDSVKALSAAQLKNATAYCVDIGRSTASLKGYFERYAEEKNKVFEERHQQNLADAQALVRQKAKAASWDATQTAAEMATRIAALQAQLGKDQADLQNRVGTLGLALDGLVTRCAQLVKSETKLNEYAQSKKTQDAINQVMTDTLGVDTTALNRQIDALAEKVPKL